MNEIILTENDEICITQLDTLTANTPFYHVDRLAAMNVMIYVLSGCIHVTEEDRDYAVREGEMLFLKKGTHQYGRKLIQAGTSWIYAHFQINQISAADEAEGRADTGRITLPKQNNLFGHNDIRKRLEKLCLTYSAGKTMSRKRAALGLYELFLDVEEWGRIGKTNSLIEKVDSFISSNLYCNLSGEDFEKEFHITYKYLNRVYKKHCGRSIMQTHYNERMKLAASELRTTNRSVNAISEELGFSDPLYFSKCFKRYSGAAPRKYRQTAIRNF